MNRLAENGADHNGHKARKASNWAFVGFALIALYFLFTEHRAHLFGALPYLLLAACPLMHFFHHRGGHGHHQEHANDSGGSGPAQGRDQRGDTASPDRLKH